MERLVRLLSLAVMCLQLTACSDEPQGRPCATVDDCLAGEICLDGFCEPLAADADGDVDADADADGDGDGDGDADADADAPPAVDTDGDGISDLHEGLGAVDTDADGTPDTADLDSDDDGIADRDEAGDETAETPPADTDRDGTPDFRDLDADGDGIDDTVEGASDADGDGRPSFVDVDADGDGIADRAEGLADADDDEVANYLDDDSDGDGIPDAVEAGDEDVATEPPDSDGDGAWDFLDLDADGDTIDDVTEGAGDPDDDGLGSFRDPDADGDGVPDALEAGDAEEATAPVDTDGDGISDSLDDDSDADTIADWDEYVFETDGDGAFDFVDTDSDDDGLPDEAEAGDAELATVPVDTDDDGLADYRDTDSDNDGLSDATEAFESLTDPCVDDTDGDGASDLVEVASGTDPTSDADNPRVRGDFVFVVPFEAPPEPPEDTLVFGTEIQMADVYFAIDRSASMGGELTNLRTTLQTTIVPAVDTVIPDVWFGVGFFDQCPMRGYCTSSGTPVWIRNYQSLAEDPALTEAALGEVTSTCNGANEPYISTMWLVANGDPSVWGWLPERVFPRDCAAPDAVGYPCFRAGAVPILVMFGDESFYTQSYGSGCDPTLGDAPSFEDATAELNRIGARFIGINSGSSLPGFTDAATATGSVGADGSPLAFTIPSDGSGLGDQVVDAIEYLASQVPMDITALAVDVDEGPADLVDATVFIDHLEPNETGGVADPADPARVCVGGLAVIDADGDGAMDTFDEVLPGTVVCFDIVARENTTVPTTAEVQMFRAEIRVLGRAESVLDRRDVYFLVPPEIPGGQ